MFLIKSDNYGHVVKALCCEGGGEFDCSEVRQILAEKGTVPTLYVP